MSIECKHWSPAQAAGGGNCAIGKYGGRPSLGTCSMVCPEFQGERKLPPQPERMPGLSEMVISFSSAILKWVKAGHPVVPEGIFQERLAVCRSCPKNLAKVPRAVKCEVCGCRRLKLWLATEACPDKPPRWRQHEESKNERD